MLDGAPQFDHVIIGSAINALVAGSMLLGKDDSVLMIEKENRIGGAWSSNVE